MATTIDYKGRTIASFKDGAKVLTTAGTWMEGNLIITDETGDDQYIYQDSSGYIRLSSTLPSTTASVVLRVIPKGEITIAQLIDSNGDAIVDQNGDEIITVAY